MEISLDHKINELKAFFENDRMLQAIELLNDIDLNIKMSEEECKLFNSNKYVQQIRNDIVLINKSKDLFERMKSTKPDSSSNGIESWFINENELNTITVFSKTVVNTKLEYLLSTIIELEDIPLKIQRFEEVKKLKEFSSFRWMVRTRVKMPFFVSDREVVGSGFAILTNNNILLPFKSLAKVTSYLDTEIPAEDNAFKRIDLNFAFMNIKPLGQDQTEISFGFNVDPKVPLIPWFLLNKVIKEGSYYVTKEIRRVMENLDQKTYEDYYAKKKEFYDMAFERLATMK